MIARYVRAWRVESGARLGMSPMACEWWLSVSECIQQWAALCLNVGVATICYEGPVRRLIVCVYKRFEHGFFTSVASRFGSLVVPDLTTLLV